MTQPVPAVPGRSLSLPPLPNGLLPPETVSVGGIDTACRTNGLFQVGTDSKGNNVFHPLANFVAFIVEERRQDDLRAVVEPPPRRRGQAGEFATDGLEGVLDQPREASLEARLRQGLPCTSGSVYASM